MSDASLIPASTANSAPGAPVEVQIGGSSFGDRAYRWATTGMALIIPILLLLIALEVFAAGWPALRRFGWDFFLSSDWDAVKGKFGAAPAVFGTIVSSIIALVIATPLAVGVAIFLSEFAPRWLRQPVAFLVDLLAAIPSVVYGLWGVLVLLPFLRESVMPFREGHVAPRRIRRCSPARRTDRACSRRDPSWRSWCCRTSPP